MSMGKLALHSRLRVTSIVIRGQYSPSMRLCLLRRLDATGTVIGFDPRFTYPYRIKFDDGDISFFAEESLEMLEPGNTNGSSERATSRRKLA